MLDSFATPWTVACQALLSIVFPSPGDLPDPGIEPESPALQPDSLPSEPPGKPNMYFKYNYIIYGAAQVALVMKNQPANAGDIRDLGSIPG